MRPHVAVAATLPVWTCVAIAEEPQQTVSFRVSRSDFAVAQALTNKIATLSPTVRRREVSELAQCVYSTANRLRQEYGAVGPPAFSSEKAGLSFAHSIEIGLGNAFFHEKD